MYEITYDYIDEYGSRKWDFEVFEGSQEELSKYLLKLKQSGKFNISITRM